MRQANLDEVRTIAFIDVETTGLGHDARVVTMAVVCVDVIEAAKGTAALKMVHLIFDPGQRSERRAEQIHGWHDWTLRHQEQFKDHAKYVRDLIEGCDAIGGHNVAFDDRMISKEMLISGQGALTRPHVCTQKLSAGTRRFGPSLDVCLQAAGLSRMDPDNHNALEDAWLTMSIFLWLRGHSATMYGRTRLPSYSPKNLKEPPEMPEGRLPRRKART